MNIFESNMGCTVDIAARKYTSHISI